MALSNIIWSDESAAVSISSDPAIEYIRTGTSEPASSETSEVNRVLSKGDSS